jgi:glycosyltransferase involved in cell wall biosynthesis
MAEPLVSVVIPTYKRPKELLERALPSVLAQTHKNLEIIVVGDGPNPGAERGIEELDDDRVQYAEVTKQVLPEDKQAAWCVLGLDARNHGYDLASGGYIMGLDDDDAWLPYTVKLLLENLIETQVDVAYGRSKAFKHDGGIQWYGRYPPEHFAYCEGAFIAKHDMGFRLDPDCVKRGLPEDGDKIDRMVAAGKMFTFVDQVVHYYYPNPR